MKTNRSFLTFLIVLSFFSANAFSAVAIDEDLRENSPQARFMLKHAPILILLDYRPGLDTVVRVDYVKENEFNTQLTAQFAKKFFDLDKKSGKIRIDDKFVRHLEDQQSLVPSDFFETGKYVGVGMSFYRALDVKPDHFHFHDTESAVLIFEKPDLSNSLETPDALDQTELLAVVSNSHGEAVVSAGSPKYLSHILPDVSDAKSFDDEPLIRDQAKKGNAQQGGKRVLDRIKGRAVLISYSGGHAMGNVNDLQRFSKALEESGKKGSHPRVMMPLDADKETYLELQKALPSLRAHYFKTYGIQILGNAVKTQMRDLFGDKVYQDEEDEKSPLVPAQISKSFYGPVEDWAGRKVDVKKIPCCMRNPDGVGHGANPVPNWAMSCQVGPNGERIEIKNKSDAAKRAKRIHWAAFHEVMKEAFWKLSDDPKAYVPVYNSYLEVVE